MDPNQITAQSREAIIKELNIGHLSPEEQETILDGLGDILLRRVLLKLLELLPENERDNFGNLFAAQDAAGMQTLVEKYVPNSSDIISSELRAGIEEHKRLVNEEVTKNAANAPASAAPQK